MNPSAKPETRSNPRDTLPEVRWSTGYVRADGAESRILYIQRRCPGCGVLFVDSSDAAGTSWKRIHCSKCRPYWRLIRKGLRPIAAKSETDSKNPQFPPPNQENPR